MLVRTLEAERGTHKQQNEVRCLRAELQSCTSAFQGHHRWCAPWAMERFSATTRHYATTETTSQAQGNLKNGRQNDDAISVVEDALRNVVGSVENFFHYLSSVCDTICFFVLRDSRKNEYESQAESEQHFVHEERIA